MFIRLNHQILSWVFFSGIWWIDLWPFIFCFSGHWDDLQYGSVLCHQKQQGGDIDADRIPQSAHLPDYHTLLQPLIINVSAWGGEHRSYMSTASMSAFPWWWVSPTRILPHTKRWIIFPHVFLPSPPALRSKSAPPPQKKALLLARHATFLSVNILLLNYWCSAEVLQRATAATSRYMKPTLTQECCDWEVLL